MSSLVSWSLNQILITGFTFAGSMGRSLPPLAKKYVLQLLYIDVPVSAKTLEEWVLPDGLSKFRVAIDRLVQLRLFEQTERFSVLTRSSLFI